MGLGPDTERYCEAFYLSCGWVTNAPKIGDVFLVDDAYNRGTCFLFQLNLTTIEWGILSTHLYVCPTWRTRSVRTFTTTCPSTWPVSAGELSVMLIIALLLLLGSARWFDAGRWYFVFVFVCVLVLQLSTPLGLFYPIHQPLIVIGGLCGGLK